MMQSKISAFFKPKSTSNDPSSASSSSTTQAYFCKSEDQQLIFDEDDEDMAFYLHQTPEIRVTYSRRAPKSARDKGVAGRESMDMEIDKNPDSLKLSSMPSSSSKTLNKKRSYAQLHLDLGQADFNLRSCLTCGLKYAPGDEADEKNHKIFHKNYTHGIPFKGWSKERLVHMPSLEDGRIILVLDGGPPLQRNKVQEVVKLMEAELGEGWIFHKLCKVYLFVSSQRVAGCLIAEPIESAFEAVSCSENGKPHKTDELVISSSSFPILQCGNVRFHREVTRRSPSFNSRHILDEKHNGALVCKDETVPAVCGIRAIWVTPSNRRKHMATHLLDALRKTFCTGTILEKSKIAFSQPTSTGQALASKYTGTQSFLVYKSIHSGC